jgi:TolB-like protein
MVWKPFQKSGPTSQAKVMLAVLPFDNLSPDPEQDYFGDGITEEMLAQLGRLQPNRLGVIARTSIMRYKGTQKPISEIGRELGVDYILEGSVRRADNRVRVTAQLIQVSDETHLWADSYDRELRDILMLQSDVAQAIAREIHLTLSAQQRSRLQSPRTLDQEAFEAYLKGRYWWNRRSPEAMLKGIDYFNQAIAADPSYAPAYAGLANSYLMLGAYDALPPKEANTKAKAAATKALEIDPLLADAEACMAYVTFLHDWNWEAAEQRYQRALQLDANYAMGHIWYAVFLASRERPTEAIEQSNLALELDPLSLIVGALRGWVLYFCGDYDASIKQCEETLELDSTFFPAHLFVSRSYLLKGMCEEANRSLKEAYRLTGDDPTLQSELAYSLAMCGKTEMARRLILEMERDDARGYLVAINLALLHTGMGNHDDAITWLEAAIEERYPWMVQLRVEPWWKPLRDHPRYRELEQRIGL